GHEGQSRIELEAGARARARAVAEDGAKRMAGYGDGRRGKAVGAAGNGDRNAAGEAGSDPVREDRNGRLLVQDDGQAQERGTEHDGQRDEAAGTEDDAGVQGA